MKEYLQEIVAELPFLETRHLQPVARTAADYKCPSIAVLSRVRGGSQESKKIKLKVVNQMILFDQL